MWDLLRRDGMGCVQSKSPFPERGRDFEIDRKSNRPMRRPATSQSERILSGGLNGAGGSNAGHARVDVPGRERRGSGAVVPSLSPAVLDPTDNRWVGGTPLHGIGVGGPLGHHTFVERTTPAGIQLPQLPIEF